MHKAKCKLPESCELLLRFKTFKFVRWSSPFGTEDKSLSLTSSARAKILRVVCVKDASLKAEGSRYVSIVGN